VTDDQLRTLYRHAKCVALVSLHEGFGLPVLEAMAVGVPVVASTAGALPETAAGAAVLVDPFDVKSIASGIEEAVARRDVLVSAGLRRAAACSWRKAAELTVAVYRELV
jgi:glycosyltransferase involved in cell wall biosynthesis